MNPKTWNMLRPGADEWEFWKFRPGVSPVCESLAEPSLAGSVPQMTVALASRDLLAVPLWLPTTANSAELAELELTSRHLLRRGMEVRCVPIETAGNRSLVLALASADLPQATTDFQKAGRFDATARTWPPDGADVVIWKELGTLCFALFRKAQCVFFSSGGPGVSPSFCSAVKRTILRLRAEEILIQDPTLVRLYGEFPESDRLQLLEGLGIPLEYTAARPYPALPSDGIDLPPQTVRELRENRRRRARWGTIGLIALAVYGVIALAVAAELGLREWRARSLRQEAAKLAPAAEAARADITRWRAIRNAVDPRTFAIDLLSAVAAQLPGDQVRLTVFSLEPGFLSLSGEAQDVAQAYAFIEKIRATDALGDFDWTATQPQLAGKTNVRFEMEGRMPNAQANEE